MKTKHTNVTANQVKHIANLAHIPVTEDEARTFANAFEETLEVVDTLQQIDVKKVAPTHQVTGLENVWREDVVDESRMFDQPVALTNSPHHHQGFFVVEQIIEQED